MIACDGHLKCQSFSQWKRRPLGSFQLISIRITPSNSTQKTKEHDRFTNLSSEIKPEPWLPSTKTTPPKEGVVFSFFSTPAFLLKNFRSEFESGSMVFPSSESSGFNFNDSALDESWRRKFVQEKSLHYTASRTFFQTSFSISFASLLFSLRKSFALSLPAPSFVSP